MKKLIVGNWKLHPATLEEAKQLFDAVKNGTADAAAEVVVCPPFMHLADIAAIGGMKLGAQNTRFDGALGCRRLHGPW